MRAALLCVLWCGCAGGQTGEITEMTACTEPADATLAASERAEIEALGAPATQTLTWEEDGTTTELTASFAIADGRVTELRGPGCERPVLVVPIALSLETADGVLAETLEGTLERPAGAESGGIRATRPVRDVEGSFDPSAFGPLTDDAVLLAELTRGADIDGGRLFVAPGGGADEQPVATW